MHAWQSVTAHLPHAPRENSLDAIATTGHVNTMDTASWQRASGWIAGALLAPAVAVGSFARRARVFHPHGSVLWGHVTAVGDDAAWRALGGRLEGNVMARFSSAWWKWHDWPDVLGCALRFTDAAFPSVDPSAGDQDLLLATVRVPLTTLLAPLATRFDDFIDNAYFGVSPFAAPPLGRIKLRVRALQTPTTDDALGSSRIEKLEAALRQGPLLLSLEARPARVGTRYVPIATIALIDQVVVDQAQLSFDPFRSGRGITPVGFVHMMRKATYAASRSARALARGNLRTTPRRISANAKT